MTCCIIGTTWWQSGIDQGGRVLLTCVELTLDNSFEMSLFRKHPFTTEMVWSNQASVSHGSYYTHLPNSDDLGYHDQETAPSHTCHHDGSQFSQQQLELIRNYCLNKSKISLLNTASIG